MLRDRQVPCGSPNADVPEEPLAGAIPAQWKTTGNDAAGSTAKPGLIRLHEIRNLQFEILE
jgi:hypothetical protein